MPDSWLMSPFISLWKILEAYGHDPEPIFLQEGVDYDMILRQGARISFKEAKRIWMKAAETIEDPCFGLRSAEFWHPSNANALGYASLASSTLREAITRVSRYSHMISKTDEVLQENTAEGLVVTLVDSLKQHARVVFAMANFMTACRFNYGEGLNPVAVSFIHSEPSCGEKYVSFFRAPVRFSAKSDSITLATVDADKKLPSGNPYLSRIHEEIVVKYLDKLDRDDIINRVRSAIIDHLPSGNVTHAKISKSLAISVRSLQRKLQQAGTTFRNLLDSTREELARQYVRDTSVDLIETAFLLGFSEHSAFSRAFKRWTGFSPKEVRKG